MKNLEIAWAFSEIADLMEIKGENPFKIRAYRRAAETLKEMDEDVEALVREGRIQDLPGVGEGLGKKIVEMVDTGRLEFLEKLRGEVPPGLIAMLAIPGLGPAMVRKIHGHLGITDLEDLERAVKERRIRSIPGFGSKTESIVKKGIELLRSSADKVTLQVALPLAEEAMDVLRLAAGTGDVSVTGDLRRWAEMVSRVELIAAADEPAAALDVFEKLPWIHEVTERSCCSAEGRTIYGLRVRLEVVRPQEFTMSLLVSTGSDGHVAGLREAARAKGVDLDGARGQFRSEDDVYRFLGMEPIPPELREGAGEIEAALEGRLPRLLAVSDIRGDLHMHTRWSDGGHSVEEMAAAARDLGYRYIAVCDHTKALGIAGGLSPERLGQQMEEIRRLRGKLSGMTVLAGSEVDILADGSLDIPDDILSELDIVVASIHSGFKQDEDQITARIISAMENPHVDIIAHPTGRLLGRRPGYAVNLDRVIEAAARTGTALEINSYPDRLDLSGENARKAARAGVKIAINTDSHAKEQLSYMRYGVATARRGWLTPADVINAWDLESLVEWLSSHKRQASGRY